MNIPRVFVAAVSLAAVSVSSVASAADWLQFRGPNGSGITADQAPPPEWSSKKNLKWKIDLPGPGSSSPIVVGNKIFVTCWSGYGTDSRNPGQQADLRRHLVCVDRKNGKILWKRTVKPELPEQSYRGFFTQHGFATNTPVSDGKSVFVFYGKTGVLAYDLDGKQLWHVNVGKGLDSHGWGSGASPILYKDKIIVNAASEDTALIALDKKTGKEIWKKKAGGFASNWGTPVLAKTKDGATELVLSLPKEIWGFNPDTGKFLWYCEAPNDGYVSGSPVADGDVVYFIGGGARRRGAIAVRTGGKKDVTRTHTLWTGRTSARICTPIAYKGRVYMFSNNALTCFDAKTGKELFRGRLSGGGGGGGGRFGGSDYGSPVLAGGKIYFFSRSGTGYVIEAGKEFKQLSDNSFGDPAADFSASPAISNGELFVRSSKKLYCIAKTGDE